MNDRQITNEEKGVFTINTREIYNALVNLGELSEGTQYRVWIKDKIISFNWEENKDYICRLLKSPQPSGTKELKIYFITKEASLLLRQKTSPDGLEVQKKANSFTINTRYLHKELGVKEQYADWIKRLISDFNLEENIDYVFASEKSEAKVKTRGGHNRKDCYVRTAIKDLIISKHNKEADKSLTEFASKVAEFKGDSLAFAKYVLAEWERDRAKLNQITTQQNYHNSQLTTFTDAYHLVKAELSKKYNIKEYKVKFKRETIINLLLSESLIIREGKRLKLVATDKGLEKGYIDNKIDTSIEGKAFKTPALTSEGVKYILKEFVEDN